MSGYTAFLCTLILVGAITDRDDGWTYVVLLICTGLSAVFDAEVANLNRNRVDEL